jgi:hypothetical protein
VNLLYANLYLASFVDGAAWINPASNAPVFLSPLSVE